MPALIIRVTRFLSMAGTINFDVMPNFDAIERLAAHVVETTFEDIAPEAILSAKTFILDTLGVAIAGSTGPQVKELILTARGWGEGNSASIWGSKARLPALGAALINAYQGHNSEFDAIHEGAVIHPLASILGAIFAVAERDGGITGQNLLTSVVLGIDVSCSIGLGATETLKFFRPATAGSFGAVAGLAKAYNFEVKRLVSAFGIQLGQIGGTMQAHEEGTPLLGLQMGFCTRNAIVSFDLARAGIVGSSRVLEGDYGYYALFEGGSNIDAALTGLGEIWRVCDISHKPFPCGRATHGVIDGLLQLRSGNAIEFTEVEAIRVEVTPLVKQLTGRPMVEDPGVNYARLCIPYVGAVALKNGNVGTEDFKYTSLYNSEIRGLAEKFEITVSDNCDPNALAPLKIWVRLKDGTEHSICLTEVLGNPSKPLSYEQHITKFWQNWTNSAEPLDRINGEQLIEQISNLEKLADCRHLVKLLTVPQ